MPPIAKRSRSVWAWCRCSFRWIRISVLAAILLLLAALTWLRLVGLPDFLRTRLVDELARRGVVANFRSLHFYWFRGLVAEDLRVAWGGTNGTQIQIAEADLDLDIPSRDPDSMLLRGVSVRRGTLILPLPLTNEPPLNLQLDDVMAQIRFHPGDHWEVPRLSARMAGVQLELRASLTNTAALRRPRPAADPAARDRRIHLLRALVTELQGWTEASSARIEVNLNLDGKDVAAAHGDLYLEVPSARTLHGDVEQLRFSVRSQPGSTEPERLFSALVVLEFAGLQTSKGGLSEFSLRALCEGPPLSTLPTNATWQARFDHFYVRGCRARGVTLDGSLRLPPEVSVTAPFNFRTNLIASTVRGRAARIEGGRIDPRAIVVSDASFDLDLLGRPVAEWPARLAGTLTAASLEGRPGSTGPVSVRLDLAANRETGEPPEIPPDIGGWGVAWPLRGEVEVSTGEVRSPKLEVARLDASLDWRPPVLLIRRLDASLYRGRLQGRGSLDVPNRDATLAVVTTFDLHGLDGLLGPHSRENFERYQWTDPPWVEAQTRLILPAWTNRQPDWDGAVKPTLRVDGRFRAAAGGFKGIPFNRAESSLSFDGANWRLPDLRTERPEGSQEIAVEYNEDTRVYRVDARGTVLPPVLKPVLGDQSAEIVDLFEFRSPVDAVVSVWGPWTEGTQQSIRGSILATNFSFRGHRFDRLEAIVNYTNRFLAASPVRLNRDQGELLAEGVGYDFAEDRLWLTNTVSTLDHLVTAAVISPGFPEKLAPYRFASPPRIVAAGTIRPRHTESADLRFDIAGGPFEFWKLKADAIESRLYWMGTSLALSNLNARFFGGTLTGGARFDLQDPADGTYEFEATVRQANLGDILRDASGRTNVAGGTIDLDLAVTSARTADIHSWNGFGRAELTDGRLWDAPIFGFLSPVLNAIVPGLGFNRAKAANAYFTLTNSVIHTRDFVITCPPAKLFYRGTLDFDQRVDAKVEAQVLGDVGGIGPLFGLILRPLTKLFEFRITGTLADVETEPLYVPKFLLLPFQPLKIFRGLFGIGDRTKEPETNPPPITPEEAKPTHVPPP